MKVRTRIQWHTEENGVLKWRNPGDATDEHVPDLDDLIRAGTVEAVTDSPSVTTPTPFVEVDPAPTVPLKPGKRSAPPAAPESES